MTHAIFQILDEFDLTHPKNRASNLLRLMPSDYTSILNRLEKSIATNKTIEKDSASFELSLPYPSFTTLENIPSYSFIFDRVRFLDPIYDYCTFLEPEYEESLLFSANLYASFLHSSPDELFRNLQNNNLTPQIKSFYKNLKLTAVKKLEKTISYYIRYRDLIENNVLVPYVNTTVGYDGEVCAHFAVNMMKQQLPSKFIEDFDAQDNNYRLQVIEHVLSDPRNISSWIDTYQFFITSSVFKSLFPSADTLNINFGSEKNKRVINKVIQTGASLLGDNVEIINNIQWPIFDDSLLISTFSGIPYEELINIRNNEKLALEYFRRKTQKQLLNLHKTIGSKDYADTLRTIQIEQQQQISEIALMAERIKREFLRKTAHQISVITISAAGAVLSASAAIKDPIALLGVGASGAGLSSGISKFLENWIEYKSEAEKLREKDGYILWQMQKHRSKK